MLIMLKNIINRRDIKRDIKRDKDIAYTKPWQLD